MCKKTIRKTLVKYTKDFWKTFIVTIGFSILAVVWGIYILVTGESHQPFFTALSIFFLPLSFNILDGFCMNKKSELTNFIAHTVMFTFVSYVESQDLFPGVKGFWSGISYIGLTLTYVFFSAVLLKVSLDIKKMREQRIRDEAKKVFPYKRVKANGRIRKSNTTEHAKKDFPKWGNLKIGAMTIFLFLIILILTRISITGYINESFYYYMQELARDLVTFNATISVGLAALFLTMFLQIKHKKGRGEIKKEIMSMLDNFIGIIAMSLLLLLVTYVTASDWGTKITFFTFLVLTTFITVFTLWRTEKIVSKFVQDVFSND